MNFNSAKYQKSFRFRRWSRGGYAAFASLSFAITIGVLTAVVSEKSLKKSAFSFLKNKQEFFVENTEKESEIIDEIQTKQITQIIVTEQDINSIAAKNYSFYNKPMAIEMAFKCYFNRFFIFYIL